MSQGGSPTKCAPPFVFSSRPREQDGDLQGVNCVKLYCPLVWHFCGKTNTSKIEKLQEGALRFVFNDFISSYDNMLEKAELTTLTLSRIKTLALKVYKAIHGHSPPYMKDMFTSRQEQTQSLRNAHQLNIPCTRTVGFGSNSIQFEEARVWNHLPNKIRCAENLASFKKLNYFVHGEDVTVLFVPAISSNTLFYLVLLCFNLSYLVLFGSSSFTVGLCYYLIYLFILLSMYLVFMSA